MTLLPAIRAVHRAPIFVLLCNRIALGTLLLAIVAGAALTKITTGVVSKASAWLLKSIALQPVWPILIVVTLLALHLLWWRRGKSIYREYRLSWQLGQPDVCALDLCFAVFLSAVCTVVVSCPTETWCILRNVVDVGIFIVLLLIHVCAERTALPDSHVMRADPRERLTSEQESLLLEAPIERIEDDTLGRAQFVKHLSTEIIRWSVAPSAQSIVFGLYGGWGQGKSSALNLLHSELKKQHDTGVLTVRFDPWTYIGPDALVRNFGAMLSREVTDRLGAPGIGRLILRYARALGKEVSVGYLSLTLPDKTPIDCDVYEALSHALKESGRYLVILIDEVDRLEREELVALFSIVRSAFSAPRVTFILAMDPNTVLDTLCHSSRSPHLASQNLAGSTDRTGEDTNDTAPTKIPPELLEPGIAEPDGVTSLDHAWLDKIVARPFYLPRLSPSAIKSMLPGLLAAAGFAPAQVQEFWKQPQPIVDEYVLNLLRSPRQLKRFCTLLGSEWQRSLDRSGIARLNGEDLFFLEVVRLFFPRAIDDIWEQCGFYVEPESWDEIFRFFPIRENAEKHVREHVLNLCAREPNGFNLLGVLRRLFPKVDGAMQSYPTSGTTPSESSYRDRRIYHPQCFPFYFRDPTEGEPTPADMERYVQTLNSLEDQSSPERVKGAIAPLLQAGGDHSKTIGLLKYFASDVHAPARYDLATVLIDQGRRSHGEELREPNRDARDSLDSAVSWFQYAVDFEVPRTDNPSKDLSHLRTRFSNGCLPELIDLALFGTAACIELRPWTHDAALMADATSDEVQRRLYDAAGIPIDLVTAAFVREQLGNVIMYWHDGWGLGTNRVTETSRYLLGLAANNVGALVTLLLWYQHNGHFNLVSLYDHFGREAVLDCTEIALRSPSLAESQTRILKALKVDMSTAAAEPNKSSPEDHTGPEVPE